MKVTSQQSKLPKAKIYILDDEVIIVQRLVRALSKDGYDVEGFISGLEALQKVLSSPPDLIIMDIRLNDADGIDLMQRMLAAAPDMVVVLITGFATIDQAVEATKKGAFNYIGKPFSLANLRSIVSEGLIQADRKSEKDRAHRKDHTPERFGEIIGASQAMQAVFRTITQVAPLNCNVLILGESGTGKELIAKSLHEKSHRRKKAFVSFNCGAFADELIANELFGHEKGAFTGAVDTKPGLLETADGGTVFLDEIGEMPLPLQVKLLRVIQEQNFMRVGGVDSVDIDVRFIAASNRNLKRMTTMHQFRQDLYYRLNVVTIELPPLRHRTEDIPLLVDHFVRKAAAHFDRPQPHVAKEVLTELRRYTFPGNVRELENIIARAVALCRGKTLKLADLPPDILSLKTMVFDSLPAEKAEEIRGFELGHISKVYKDTGYNQSETARRLGISRTTLWRKLRKLDQGDG